MGRTSEITYDAVASVCTELAIGGKRPTFALIKGQLGGSYEVLKRHIDRWTEESAAGAQYALPSDLATELGIWYQRAKGKALAEATQWLDAEKALLAVREREYTETIDATKAAIAKAHEQCAQMGHELSIKTLQATHAMEKLTVISEALAASQAQLIATQAKCQELNSDIAARVSELRSERQRHTHELAMADERSRGTEKALLMRHHAEVELQKERTKSIEGQLEDQKLRSQAFEQKLNQIQTEYSKLLSDRSP
jgi:chromosome segregation ATPase